MSRLPGGALLDMTITSTRLRSLRAPMQLAVTAGLLALLWHVSGGKLIARVSGADPLWVTAGLGCATAAMAFAAMRWRYTALCVGAVISVERAMKEFYLAGFLNQVLPGGIAGDALRAWRHGKRAADVERGGMGRAIRAVVIERIANQAVMAICALVSLTLWLWMPGAFAHTRIWVPLVGFTAVVGSVPVAIAVLARRHGGGRIERLLRDGRQALLGRSMLVQLGLGFLVSGSCLAMFYCAAQAVHAPLSLFHLIALVPGALFAMSIPISIGGWGLREASAVALWTMAGLSPDAALATSIVYGLLALLGALPGAIVLAVDR
jgi:glycosyltransferase 2 family protein